jgi:thioredoxin reductase
MQTRTCQKQSDERKTILKRKFKTHTTPTQIHNHPGFNNKISPKVNGEAMLVHTKRVTFHEK